MKSVKLISLAIAMLISFLSFGQKNDSIQNNKPIGFHCAASVTKNNEALLVIDGLLVSNEVLTNLNPDKIESYNILKGVEAEALYGIRGRNGVIIIKTKNLSRRELRKLKKQSKLTAKEE